MTALWTIVSIVLILVSIVLIAAVLMQQGQRQGLGAISGGAETFLGKNKASTLEGKLKLITKVAAVVFIVLAIAATMITAHINNKEAEELQDALMSSLSEEDLAAIEAGEAHLHEDGTVHYDEEDTEGEAADETTEGEAADEATEGEAADEATEGETESTEDEAADETTEGEADSTEEKAAE